MRPTIHLPDDELADFIGAGSQRMFLRFCLRKLPPVLAAIDGVTGNPGRADTVAVGIFTQVWETAPLWGSRTGEAQRQLGRLMARAGVKGPGVGGDICPKRLNGLLQVLERDVRTRPQCRPWIVRFFQTDKSSSNTDGRG